MQARAQARWLEGALAESIGKSLKALPVVVFPGWFVDPSKERPGDVRVLEPKALPAFIENEPTRLVAPEIKLASFHLSRFIRAVKKAGEDGERLGDLSLFAARQFGARRKADSD